MLSIQKLSIPKFFSCFSLESCYNALRKAGDYMESIKQTVCENLRQIIKLKKIKSKDIAAYMGLSESSISHWLKGDNPPDMDNLYILCKYLNVSLDQVFGIDPIVVGVLNSDENDVIVAYRKASYEEKNVIRRVLCLPEKKKDEQSAI